jgi:hypothetical protein
MTLRPALAIGVVALMLFPLASAGHLGDDWQVHLEQVYRLPDGSHVWLTAQFQTYSDWPAPTDTARISALHVSVLSFDGAPVELASPSLVFVVRQGSTPAYNITVLADDLEWHTVWSWALFEGCALTTQTWKQRMMLQTFYNSMDKDLAPLAPAGAWPSVDDAQDNSIELNDYATGAGDQVVGDLEDVSHASTLNGQPLVPAWYMPTQWGEFGISGAGGAQKFSPGADGYWNCNPGGLVMP